MKLEVGQFVRTENGLIGKIIGFKGDMIETDNKRLITYKSSHSECKIKEKLIDLIEVGDYVNGREVVDIFYDVNDNVMDVCVLGSIVYDNNEIKSIVTKEQFEQMEYKVGD